MKIKTITCHDVYNYGASLQAFALQEYLRQKGHKVEIIDYKPHYLSQHYKLGVYNPKYNKPILKQLYILVKLPSHLISLKRKKLFDDFTSQYLYLTTSRYESNEELKKNLPEADLYIAGSDQIWNTIFPNGKDPAFYLDFAPETKRKASYAASFATSTIAEKYQDFVKSSINRLDYIAIREKSSLPLLEQLGIKKAIAVCDPVFLLPQQQWDYLASKSKFTLPTKKYILIYDFEKESKSGIIAKEISNKRNFEILTLSPYRTTYGKNIFNQVGPIDFLYLVKHAEFIISNSFHATAFSIIFQKNFCVLNRNDKINERMKSLLDEFDLSERQVNTFNTKLLTNINYKQIEPKVKQYIQHSVSYLNTITAE